MTAFLKLIFGGWFSVLGVLTISCAYTNSTDTDTEDISVDDSDEGESGDDDCTVPLSDFCTDCDSFDETVAENKSRTFGGAGAFECNLTSEDTVFVAWTAGGNESPDPRFYFDSETGELLAVRVFSDAPQYCDDSSGEILYGDLPDGDCDVSAQISEIAKACYRPWTDDAFEWTAEKCQLFEIE